MTTNNHLFSEALTLDQLLEIFPLPRSSNFNQPVYVDYYINNFMQYRFPRVADAIDVRAAAERFDAVPTQMEKAFRKFWQQTKEFAILSSLMSFMEQELLLQCSMDFVPPPQGTTDNDIPWTPVIHIALSSRRDCWIQLIRRNGNADYEPREEEIAFLLNEDFIWEIKQYFQNLPPADCSVLIYKIATMRYTELFRRIAQYEVQTIQNELEYRKSLTEGK